MLATPCSTPLLTNEPAYYNRLEVPVAVQGHRASVVALVAGALIICILPTTVMSDVGTPSRALFSSPGQPSTVAAGTTTAQVGGLQPLRSEANSNLGPGTASSATPMEVPPAVTSPDNEGMQGQPPPLLTSATHKLLTTFAWALAAMGVILGFANPVARSVGAAAAGKKKTAKSRAGAGFGKGKSGSKKDPVAARRIKTRVKRRKLLTEKEFPTDPRKAVPAHIPRPSYADDGIPKERPPLLPIIEVKSAKDIEQMRKSGRIAREVLDCAVRAVRPGISTEELDDIVHKETIARGAYPSPLNYNGFPKSVCTSINEVICHGIPDRNTLLKEGDILNIDVTVFFEGFHGDCSEMAFVGEVDEDARRLVQVQGVP